MDVSKLYYWIYCKKCGKPAGMDKQTFFELSEFRRDKELVARLYEHQQHLCKTCIFDFAECIGRPEFGECVGNDNVVSCDKYRSRVLPTVVFRFQ